MENAVRKTCRWHESRTNQIAKPSPLSGSEFCFFMIHSKAEERREAQARGGSTTHEDTEAPAPDVKVDHEERNRTLVQRSIKSRGEIDPRVANSVVT